MTYTAFVFYDCNIRRVFRGIPRRHAMRLRAQVRERGFRWEVWLISEASFALAPKIPKKL